MPSQSIAARTALFLVVASWALVQGQACGGRAEKGSSRSTDDSPPTSSNPPTDAATGSADAATEASPVSPAMWPLEASSCASLEWETCTSLPGNIGEYFVAVDAEDHFFIAGTAQLSPPDQTRTVFVAKFSSELELLWLQQIDSSLSQLKRLEVQGLAVDAHGNSFVVSRRSSYDGPSTITKVSFEGAPAWTRPCPGEAVVGVGLAVAGGGELVVADSDTSTVRLAKYSPAGDQLWEQDRPAEDTEVVNHVTADGQGNSWLAADRRQASGRDWQAGNLEMHGPNGELKWKTSLEADLFSDILSTDGGESTVLVAIPSVSLVRVSVDGDVLSRTELRHFNLGYGLGSDLDGNTWVTGYTATGPSKSTVARLSPEGHVLFSKDFDVPTLVFGNYVAQTSSGKVFIIGYQDYQSRNLVIALLQP